jgi:hypothetical protein
MTELKMRNSLLSQYRASLAMLRQAIEVCPEPLWLDPGYVNRFWHVAYHALFYTHLYLQPGESDLRLWEMHRKDAQYLGRRPWFPLNAPRIEPAYSQAELLELHKICCAEVENSILSIDLEAPSGFSWLPFKKLELQLYNIRHLQHHVGQLADRLRNVADIGIEWVCPE